MYFRILSSGGSLKPFVAYLHTYEVGNQCVVFGDCDPVAKVQIHYKYPPQMVGHPDGFVEINQAFILAKNRNLLIASNFMGQVDRDWLFAFSAILPSGFRGKAAFCPGVDYAIYCDQHRIVSSNRFAIEGFLLVRGCNKSPGIINCIDDDGGFPCIGLSNYLLGGIQKYAALMDFAQVKGFALTSN